FPVNAWPDWSALSALSKSKGWDMCHSFLIVYYWNDTEFLTLPVREPYRRIRKTSGYAGGYLF
ncbi:hypothetical protein DB011_06305, partial [Salmonella enterica subsp. enterica serovar Weltevreden]